MSPGPPSSDPPPFGKSAPMSIEAVVAVIDQKLRAGQASFGELRNRDDQLATEIGVLREMMRPKPTNWFAVVIALFSVLVTILGAVWGLNSLFSARPTRDELERDKAVIKQQLDSLTIEQRTLHDQQIEERTVLKGLGDTLIETNKKLDYLIQRSSSSGRRGATPP